MGKLSLSDQMKRWGEHPATWILSGGILLLASILLVIGILASQTYEAVYHDYATGKAQADAQNLFDRECRQITEIKAALDCAEKAVQSARETQRAEEDVHAQKQMAQWTWWLLILTGFVGITSIAITGVGTFFLVRTVQVAMEANQFQRESGLATIRAYVTVSEITARLEYFEEDSYPDLRIIVNLANSGQTPARDLIGKVSIGFQSARRTGTVIFHSATIVPHVADIFAGDGSYKFFNALIGIDGSCLEELSNSNGRFVVSGSVTYHVALDDQRKTTPINANFTAPVGSENFLAVGPTYRKDSAT